MPTVQPAACDQQRVDPVDGDAGIGGRGWRWVDDARDREVEQRVQLVVVEEGDDASEPAFELGAQRARRGGFVGHLRRPCGRAHRRKLRRGRKAPRPPRARPGTVEGDAGSRAPEALPRIRHSRSPRRA